MLSVLFYFGGERRLVRNYVSTIKSEPVKYAWSVILTNSSVLCLSVRPARLRKNGIDLVEVAPNGKPPVCRIMNYGKYRYEQQKREKEAKKKQHIVEVKEIRLSPNVEINDLKTKANNARKFIEKGNKVKVTLRFRGREMAHVQSSRHILDEFAKALEDIALVDKPAKMEGRSMAMFLTEKRS